MKKVITYGTYDLLTAGHVEHFRDAKAMGDYLIVGVSTDEFNKIKNKSSYLSFEERKFIVESIKYVDEVIPEEHWDQKVEDIKKYGISIVAMGSDWEGDERFEKLREFCDVRYTHRSGKYSSTNFRKHVDKYTSEKTDIESIPTTTLSSDKDSQNEKDSVMFANLDDPLTLKRLTILNLLKEVKKECEKVTETKVYEYKNEIYNQPIGKYLINNNAKQ